MGTLNVTYSTEQAIQYYKEDTAGDIARLRKSLKKKISEAKKNAKALVRLAKVLPDYMTVDLTGPWTYSYPSIQIPRDKLAEVRKAIGGRLHFCHKSIHNAEENTIEIHMTCEQFKGVDFWYVRPLEEGAQCKIVEVTNTYKSLVCEVPK